MPMPTAAKAVADRERLQRKTFMKSSYAGVLIACAAGLCIVFAAEPAVAANAEIETEIRILEEQEVQAVLAHDAATLERLWDKTYVVHNPEGRIVLAGARVEDRPLFQNTRASFVREVEIIVANGDVVFSMGSEIVTSPVGSANAGAVIKRRYTNVWMRKDGAWKMVARHANKVCGKD
ncbi:MAG TPA: nuclear transport factor 2 family protein [Opitutaceae bacterium]|nr:nuclear transport factor 2 family protein [Opitutaceae bacterium]